jgi:O-antigen/teichoic acid export membrane protein
MEATAERSATSIRKNITFVTGGQVVLLAIWFGATTLLARKLGPETLGFYALCTRAIRIFTSCIGDPLDLAVMREAPLYLKSDPQRGMAIVRTAFSVRAAFGAIALLIAATVPAGVSVLMFRSRNFPDLALLTGFGILTDLLLRSAAGYLQASERFGQFMTVNATWQLIRSIGIALLSALTIASATQAVAIYVAAPLIAFLVALPLLPRGLIKPFPPPSIRQVRDVLDYGKWIALGTIFATMYEGLDVFMLSWLRDERQVGIYAGAMTLGMIPDFLNGAVQTVLAPRISPAYSAGRFGALYRLYLRYALPLGAVALTGAMLLGVPIIRGLLSVRFAESADAFKILILATIFDIVFLPLPAALLAFVKPQVVPAINFMALLIVAVGGLVLIPRFGATGAAGLILAARVMIGSLTLVFTYRLLHQAGGRGFAV